MNWGKRMISVRQRNSDVVVFPLLPPRLFTLDNRCLFFSLELRSPSFLIPLPDRVIEVKCLVPRVLSLSNVLNGPQGG